MLYYIYSGHYFLTELAHNRRKEVFAMFEDDYLLRLIKEMVRTVLKLLFHIDFKEEDPVSVVFESEDAEKTLYSLIHLADQGFIYDAENQLYDFTQNPENMESLKTALLFYSHLNQLDNDFLEDHNYSREEIVSGVKDVLNRYHLDSMSALF